MSIFTFSINTKSKTHIYIQIYEYIKNEIKNGSLPCNTKLPSIRILASHLQVSRNSIEMAYGQLIDEGYIESRPKRGFFVCDIENHIVTLSPGSGQEVSLRPDPQKSEYLYQFSPYGVDADSFPYSTWRKVMRDALYDEQNDFLFEAGHPQGDQDFRQAISSYLHQSRGVRCETGQIIVGAGIDYLLILLTQILGNTAKYAVENPSYKQAYRILTHMGRLPAPVELDNYGIKVSRLRETGANVAYVTPSHHFPLGIVMPIKRRLELLSWASEEKDRYIIEDDYDSEFRYKGRPIPCLQGIDNSDKVIYLGTFSKAIAPSMRIGYMILPQSLLKIYKDNFMFYSNTVPRILQHQLTEFIQKGYFERHLNRMRNVYKGKRDLILQELAPYRKSIRITGENSGLHILIEFLHAGSEDELLRRAKAAGIQLYGLSSYYTAAPEQQLKPTLLLGYASLSEEKLKKQLKLFIETMLKNH